MENTVSFETSNGELVSINTAQLAAVLVRESKLEIYITDRYDYFSFTFNSFSEAKDVYELLTEE